jgi:N,N'-diacetyllegionaminate synthase
MHSDRPDLGQFLATAVDVESPPQYCFVIGEVGQAHDGSLGTAHSYIDAIADAGADAVKFQTHIAEAESSLDEPWRVKFSRQDDSRFEYWKRMEFTESQWKGLQQHARERNLLFLSSPFSVEAVQLLTRVGVDAWKIASGEVSNLVLISEMLKSDEPVLLSTGMSGPDEIEAAVHQIEASSVPFAVLQCTSEYPCPPEAIGLNLLADFRNRFGCAVGLSDHSGKIYAGMAAAALGASVLEMHVTFSRQMFGPDVKASLTCSELTELVNGVREITRMLLAPVDKEAAARNMEPLRKVFTKSVVARHDLPRGTVIAREHLALKKPGTGMPARRIQEFVGRRLRTPLRKDQQLAESDVE